MNWKRLPASSRSHRQSQARWCVICNRYKGTDIAAIDQSSGEIARLFDPRRDVWSDHFLLEGPSTTKPSWSAVVAASVWATKKLISATSLPDRPSVSKKFTTT